MFQESNFNDFDINIILDNYLGAGLWVGVGSALLPMALSPSLPNIFVVTLVFQALNGDWVLLLDVWNALELPPKSPATESNLLN